MQNNGKISSDLIASEIRFNSDSSGMVQYFSLDSALTHVNSKSYSTKILIICHLFNADLVSLFPNNNSSELAGAGWLKKCEYFVIQNAVPIYQSWKILVFIHIVVFL